MIKKDIIKMFDKKEITPKLCSRNIKRSHRSINRLSNTAIE
jgi:hypothetical protein